MKLLLALIGLQCLTSAVLSANGGAEQVVTLRPRRAAPALPLERQAADDEENDEIIGGTAASISSFPSLGFMYVSLSSGGQGLCGGTLYRSRYVITAAHCLADGVSAIDVYFNSTSRTTLSSGTVYRYAVSYAVHESYDSYAMKNDIAIFALNSAVTTLPSTTIGTATAGATATIAGWGRTTTGGSSSPTLMRTTVGVLDNAACSSNYQFTQYYPMTSGQVCAAAPGRDTCQGDSGGPIYVGGVQVGVTSFGIGCADSRYPGVYTRLSEYKAWLDTLINYL